MKPADFSVVIPAINEQTQVAAAIDSAWQAGAGEVIVVDGGSGDQTIEVAKQARATKVVRSLPGRGIQLNAGAFVAESEFVLFLHADNRLSADCLTQACQHPRCTWGGFRQRIDSPQAVYRWIEWGNAFRLKYQRKPFGDQAIFVRRSVFKQAGGFAEIPLMEDVEFSRRFKKIAKPLLLEGPLMVSVRRWETNGVLRQTVRNWSLQLRYAWGASPDKLRQRYQ